MVSKEFWKTDGKPMSLFSLESSSENSESHSLPTGEVSAILRVFQSRVAKTEPAHHLCSCPSERPPLPSGDPGEPVKGKCLPRGGAGRGELEVQPQNKTYLPTGGNPNIKS